MDGTVLADITIAICNAGEMMRFRRSYIAHLLLPV
jgi:hypothetical protein